MSMTTAEPRPGAIRYNLFTGIVCAFAMFIVGLWVGHKIGARTVWVAQIDENDVSVLFAYLLSTIGFMAGLGFLDYPIMRMLGRRPDLGGKDLNGWGRYLRMSTDHKTIGVQYLFGIAVFFFIGGLNAMLIRTELLRPSPAVFSPGQYLTIVGMHSTMMVMMVSSIILGPFGHYFVPLMIGAKRMAFPRL